MTFYINNVSQGVAFKDIVTGKDIGYRLCVSISGGVNVSIEKFTETQWKFHGIELLLQAAQLMQNEESD